MSLLTAPDRILKGIAQGTIKTRWGQIMRMKDPAKGEDEEYNRLAKIHGHNVAAAFTEVAPLAAERLAIAEYKLKNPQIEAVAQEILSYQEALEIAMKEVWHLTTEEKQKILTLLKKDPSMQPLKK
jgi:hypothetical protein